MTHRAGYVAIVGFPNVGKSTLLNALLGTKLSIVSPKPQTTRDSIRGIWNTKDMQIVFVDTPGWLKPSDSLQKSLKHSIVQTIHDDADSVLWLIDRAKITEEEKEFGGKLAALNIPIHLVINKVDTFHSNTDPDQLMARLKKDFPFVRSITFISARKVMGLEELRKNIYSTLPECPAYFPKDQLTDRWERFFVSELIREQIFNFTHEEVPHATFVFIDEFVEKPDRKDWIKATLIVETEGQKKILIGKSGSVIRKLGQMARVEIEKQLDRPVYLELRVKVVKNWRKDDSFIQKHTGENG